MSLIRFILKSYPLHPKTDFLDDGYKIYRTIADLYLKGEQFGIDDILKYLTFENLNEKFFKSFTNPYNFLFKDITFDYHSHTDRKKKQIKDVKNFNIGTYRFHFLSNPLGVISKDDKTITVIFECLNQSFDINNLKQNNIEIEDYFQSE